MSWLGLWIHEFHRIPAQFGFTFEGLLFHLLPALIIFLACWRYPGHVFPIYGMWVLGILHGLGGGVLSVLPLPIWPFVPDQTLSHYVVHGVYFLAQVPLLLLAFTLMRHLRFAPLAQSAKTRRAETDSVGAGRKHMHLQSIINQHRFIGMTLLASFLLFWSGAAFSIPLVDPKGSSIYILSPRQVLPVIAAHPQFWHWQSLLQMAGGVVAVLGLVLLTLTLWAAQDRKISLLGLVIFCISIMLWVIIEAFRLGIGVWATQGIASTTPALYELLYLWIEGSMFAISIALAFCSLAAFGGALLATAVLPRWAGWTILVYACASLGLIAFIGTAFIPPELAYLPLGFLGVLLLLRRSQPAKESRRTDVVTSNA